MRLTRAETKARTREELIDAAEQTFTSRGFHATSLDLVAAEAGYTKGAVYSNFESKEDLFFAVYERRVETASERQAHLVADAGDAAPEVMARTTLEKRDAGWLAVFFEFWAHVVRNPDLRERFSRLHQQARAPHVEWTREWIERNGVKMQMSPEQWLTAVYGLVSGLALEQLIDPDLPGGDVAAEIFDVLLRSMRSGEGG